jgi:CDP-diacylglycerol--serine O-phosphatidyltransferase
MSTIQRTGIQRGIVLLPNLLTTANMFLGFFAITKAVHGKFVFAAWMIILAGLFDGLDGRVARMTKTQSDFGIEYDSLADLTTFCLAPAVTVYLWCLMGFHKLAIAACFMFFACGALRLARFNVQAGSVERVHFQGLPTPAGGGVLASFLIFHHHIFGDVTHLTSAFVVVCLVALGLLMVSNVEYFSGKKIKRVTFPLMIAIIGVAVFLIMLPEIMFFVFGMIYILHGMFVWLWKSPQKIRGVTDLIKAFFEERRAAKLQQVEMFEEEEMEEEETEEVKREA